jgi:hypothetical protein
MDKRIAIWNILHDGDITAVSKEDDNTVKIFVSIPYLRRRLEPVGDSFVVILSGLTRLDFSGWYENPTSLQDAIESGKLEILSTNSESMPITIATIIGDLTLDFQRISFTLDTGQPIEYEAIETACDDYWAEWSAKRAPINK